MRGRLRATAATSTSLRKGGRKPSLRRRSFWNASPCARASRETIGRMDLILWRHAEAEPGEPDLGRRLTPKGLKQAARMAEWLDARLPDTCKILSSPAERA